MRLQSAEVAFVDSAAAVQDHDAVRIGVLERLRPGELAAEQIDERERIDRGLEALRRDAQIARRTAAAPYGDGRRQLAHMRQSPANLRKFQESVVLEADQFRQADGGEPCIHPNVDRVRSVGIRIFDAVNLECSAFHGSPCKLRDPQAWHNTA